MRAAGKATRSQAATTPRCRLRPGSYTMPWRVRPKARWVAGGAGIVKEAARRRWMRAMETGRSFDALCGEADMLLAQGKEAPALEGAERWRRAKVIGDLALR